MNDTLHKILIADSGRASLVMTSEIFKDHFSGVQLFVARNAKEALESIEKETSLDAAILDFHLPDLNGAELALMLKKKFDLPVLITAMPSETIQQIIEEKCYAYEDCLNWIAKPVRADKILEIVKRFFIKKYRTQRRLTASCPVLIQFPVQKGKTKKHLKLFSILKDISLGGGKCLVTSDFLFEKQDHLDVLEELRALGSSYEIQFLFPPKSCLECESYDERIQQWLGNLIDVLRHLGMLDKHHLSLTTKQVTFEKIRSELARISKNETNVSESQIVNGYLRWESFSSDAEESLQWFGGVEWSSTSLSDAKALFHSIYLARKRLPTSLDLEKLSQNLLDKSFNLPA
jgi:CheY-like chemotaxis protein